MLLNSCHTYIRLAEHEVAKPRLSGFEALRAGCGCVHEEDLTGEILLWMERLNRRRVELPL